MFIADMMEIDQSTFDSLADQEKQSVQLNKKDDKLLPWPVISCVNYFITSVF